MSPRSFDPRSPAARPFRCPAVRTIAVRVHRIRLECWTQEPLTAT